MYKTLIVFIICLAGHCYAQRTVDFGLSVPLFIKVNALSGEDVFKRFFGAAGLNAILKVNGTSETDMVFQMSAGIFYDNRRFNSDLNTGIITRQYFLNLNPSVAIPSKWPGVKYDVGIGAFINVGQSAGIFGPSILPGPAYTSAVAVGQLMDRNGRKVVPFVSFGITIPVKKHLKLQCLLQPALLNCYESGTTVNFNSSTTNHDFSLDYQPVYFGMKLFYFLAS